MTGKKKNLQFALAKVQVFVKSDFFYLNEVGIAGFARGDTACDDDIITLLQRQGALCNLLGSIEKHIGRWESLTHGRDYSPGKSESAPGAFVCGETNNGNGGTESGYHSGGHAGYGAGNYCLGI